MLLTFFFVSAIINSEKESVDVEFNRMELNADGVPKYRQLAARLETLIRDGELAASTRIPSERLLARQLGVSVITVNSAMNELMNRGLIERRVGSGTYVSELAGSRTCHRRIGFFNHQRIQPGANLIGTMLETLFRFWGAHDADLLALTRLPGEYEQTIAEYRLDGVLIYSPLAEFVPAIRKLVRREFPVVALSSILPELADISFGYSNVEVLDAAVEYLAKLGHRDIAMLLPGDNETAYRGRAEGFQRAMWKYRLPLNPDWQKTGTGNFAEYIRELLSSPTRPGAVILGSCGYAETLYAVAVELKLEIPRDLSVVSIDEDAKMLTLPEPPSAFRVDFVALTLEGSETLLARLEQREPAAGRERNFEFVDRGTCMAIPVK